LVIGILAFGICLVIIGHCALVFGFCPFEVPVEIKSNKNQDQADDDRIERTQNHAYFFPMFAELISCESQDGAPDERPKESVRKELNERHPGNSSRNADESTDYRQQPRDEGCQRTFLLEPAVGKVKVVVRNEQVFTVLHQERTPTLFTHEISGNGAYCTTHRTISAGNECINNGKLLPFDKHPAGEGHNELAGKRDAGALNGHEHNHSRPLNRGVNVLDEADYGLLNRTHVGSLTKRERDVKWK